MVLNLWDCGGQDSFYESYFNYQQEFIFRSVEVCDIRHPYSSCWWCLPPLLAVVSSPYLLMPSFADDIAPVVCQIPLFLLVLLSCWLSSRLRVSFTISLSSLHRLPVTAASRPLCALLGGCRVEKVLIYVFDVESNDVSGDLDRYRGVLEAVERNSPDAR